MAEILYGIRESDQKIINIYEIGDKDSGEACGCKCPSCGRNLLACSLNGKVTRYFRHHVSKKDSERFINCDPIAANETALHRMAKSIIEAEEKILVPPKNISCVEAGIFDLPQQVKNELDVFRLDDARIVKGTIEIEKNLEVDNTKERFIPDVCISTERGELLVEIFIRHKVDAGKLEKVKRYGKAMLEVDLSDYLESSISTDELKKMILSETAHKKWVYYPLSDGLIKKAKNFYEEQEVVLSYRKAEVERRKTEAEQKTRELKRQQAKEQGQKKINELFMPQNYVESVKRLRNDREFAQSCAKHRKTHWYDFGEEFCLTNSVPFFIDIPITGEMIFQCDRRVWQSLIFNRYVFGRKEIGSSFNANNIFDDLRKDYAIPVDWDLSYRLKSPLSRNADICLSHDVIDKYLDYLGMLGFIDEKNYNNNRDKWMTVLANKTIVPPDSVAAGELKEVIASVNCYAPGIDMLIYEKFLYGK